MNPQETAILPEVLHILNDAINDEKWLSEEMRLCYKRKRCESTKRHKNTFGILFRKKRDGLKEGKKKMTEDEIQFCIFPRKNEVYSINSWYAGRPYYVTDPKDAESYLCHRELRISLEASDWYKFQDQPFYRDLIQYLDNLKTQKHSTHPDKEQYLLGDMGL